MENVSLDISDSNPEVVTQAPPLSPTLHKLSRAELIDLIIDLQVENRELRLLLNRTDSPFIALPDKDKQTPTEVFDNSSTIPTDDMIKAMNNAYNRFNFNHL